MVKFLKFVLFIIIIAFAFALGVKFSDSFRGTAINPNSDKIRIEAEMNRAFDGANINPNQPIANENIDTTPLTDVERGDVNMEQQPVIEYVDIEVVEPMDNIPDMPVDSPLPMDTNPQNVPAPVAPATAPAPNANGVPAPAPAAPTAPAVAPAPAAPAAPAKPTPAAPAARR